MVKFTAEMKEGEPMEKDNQEAVIVLNLSVENIPTNSLWRQVAEAKTGLEAVLILSRIRRREKVHIPAPEHFTMLASKGDIYPSPKGTP